MATIQTHLLIRTGEFTIYDMTTGTEYEFHEQPNAHAAVDQTLSAPRLTARSIHTEDVWAMTIAEETRATKIWQWLQIHAKNQRDLEKEINDVMPF